MRGAAAATFGQRSSTGHLQSGSDSSKRAKNPAKPRCAASSMPSSENNFLDPAGSQVRAVSSHQESRGGVSEIFQEALSEIQEEGMRDAARLVNGPGSSTNGAKEETARPKSSTMTAPIERTESIVLGGSTSALERSHNCALASGWRSLQRIWMGSASPPKATTAQPISPATEERVSRRKTGSATIFLRNSSYQRPPGHKGGRHRNLLDQSQGFPILFVAWLRPAQSQNLRGSHVASSGAILEPLLPGTATRSAKPSPIWCCHLR